METETKSPNAIDYNFDNPEIEITLYEELLAFQKLACERQEKRFESEDYKQQFIANIIGGINAND